ncbi:hypothetical protein EX30DRAFT_347285 [Ascodesmis nigricans]|uniref:HSF-type DNA-binding domain-containing protein n=1 Tax=Ascodesmis nigricans TaxID=341454 RepID=A0A4S2N1C9_9PEZI|nr:hypothetical protein EX30DRAFT_347285 [Ascodesmis nigricans]
MAHNYLPNTSAPMNADLMYNSSIPPTQSDGTMYGPQPPAQQQSQQQQQQQMGMFGPGNGQVARLQQGSQLIRIPNFPALGIPQMPPGMGTPSSMGMNMAMMGQAGSLMHQPGIYGLQNELNDPDLTMKIDKMKKKRASIPPFVLKLSSFVNDPKTDHLIRWSDSGNSFMVLDEDEFSKTLIPDLFKHNNYASFVRQLNMYGFHKVVGLADGSLKTSEQRSKPPSEYENPYFKRGQPDLLWLIQKPKSKKGGRRGKVPKEEPDSDKEEEDATAAGEHGDGTGNGFIEGPKDGTHGSNSRSERFDMNAVLSQIEAVRNHQAMISNAIQRLRKDHQQLYEQSLAFQTLHDRHETSIQAILNFLASVYDKSLAGHINGAPNNLFAHQVEPSQAMHRGTSNTGVAGAQNGAIIGAPTGRPPGANILRTPAMNRRRPLLLEGGPQSTNITEEDNVITSHDTSPTLQNTYPNFTSGNIQELFSPATSNNNPNSPAANGNSPRNSPKQQLQQPDVNTHQAHLTDSPFNLFTVPVSPTPSSTSAPATSPQPRQHTAHAQRLPANAHVTRQLARALASSPLGNHSQALQNHNDQLAAKATQIEELQSLQAEQSDKIDELMGLVMQNGGTNGPHMDYINNMNGASAGLDTPGAYQHDLPLDSNHDVDQFLNWGDTSGFNLSGMNGNSNAPDENFDVEELLKGAIGGGLDDVKMETYPDQHMDVDGATPLGGHVGTNPSTVAPSPASTLESSATGVSSVTGKAREEVQEENDIEEVQVKRRKVA